VNMMAVLLMVADAVNVVDVAIVIDDQNLRPILIGCAWTTEVAFGSDCCGDGLICVTE
jgi:hypothetical protein